MRTSKDAAASLWSIAGEFTDESILRTAGAIVQGASTDVTHRRSRCLTHYIGGIAESRRLGRVRGMHLRGLDMNLLVALDALIKDKNISRSGERLHLSQSGMSTALGLLFEYFPHPPLATLGPHTVLPSPEAP